MIQHKIVDGKIVALTPQEITDRQNAEAAWLGGAYQRAMNDLRQKRNALLSATDYLALSDQTLSPEMSAYRQALRDITEGLLTVEEVKAVVFPTKP